MTEAGRPSQLDELNGQVTEAIMIAEQLEDIGDPEAQTAYGQASILEEQIAAITANSSYEGQVARRGAVRAAVKSGNFERAGRLVAAYTAEPDVDPELSAGLRDLMPKKDRTVKRKKRKEAPKDLHELEGRVEELIDADRAPFGFAAVYSVGVPNSKRILVLVPPVGTQKGDIMEGSYAENFTIKSPTGEVRGRTEMHSLTPKQAERLKGKISAHLAEKVRKGNS